MNASKYMPFISKSIWKEGHTGFRRQQGNFLFYVVRITSKELSSFYFEFITGAVILQLFVFMVSRNICKHFLYHAIKLMFGIQYNVTNRSSSRIYRLELYLLGLL
jgi:hypothetical protein